MGDDAGYKIRYLEMIQAIITRMAANSFALKSWTVALVAAVLALANKKVHPAYFLIAFVPITVFWFLDTYYLQLERKYRLLYKLTTRKAPAEIDFALELSKGALTNRRSEPGEGPAQSDGDSDRRLSYGSCFWSTTEVWFYAPTAVLSAIVAGVSLCLGGR